MQDLAATSHRLLLSCDAVGGVWQYSLDVAAARGAQGAQTLLAVLGPPPNADQRQEAAALPGVELIETGLPLDWTAKCPGEVLDAAENLARLAGREQADLVQVHAPALVGRAVWPAPLLAVAHSCVATWWRAAGSGPLPDDLAWRAELTGLGLRRADLAVAPSRAFAADLAAAYGLDRPVAVVHNGRALPSQPQGPAPDGPVLTVGRLWDRAKNAQLLDRVAARVRGPIVAAGPLTGPHGESATLPALQTVGTLGRSRLEDCYRGAAVFASPAVYEPFGLAVLEAAGHGLPLVLSDIPTFRELWGGAALLLPADDDGAWVATLTMLLNDRERRTALGEAARARSLRYGREAMAARLAVLHGDLVNAVRLAATG